MLNYELINDDLKVNYYEKFGCRIVYSYIGRTDVIGMPGNVYEIRNITEKEINILMRESIESGENILLERFKDNKCTIDVKSGCDY